MSEPTAVKQAPKKKQWVLRLLVLFLATLGAITTGLLGSYLLSELPTQREQVRRGASVGAKDANTVAQNRTDLNRLEVTAYFLMGAAGLGFLCAYFTTVDRRGFFPGVLLLSAVAAIPILTLNPDVLLNVSPLLPAGLLALLVWRPRRGTASWGTFVMTALVGILAITILGAAAVGRSQPELFVTADSATPPKVHVPDLPNVPKPPNRPNRPPLPIDPMPN